MQVLGAGGLLASQETVLYAGEALQVDHIVPLAVCPWLDCELANLELLLSGLNMSKGIRRFLLHADEALDFIHFDEVAIQVAELELIDAAVKAAGERPATWRRNALLAAGRAAKSDT